MNIPETALSPCTSSLQHDDRVMLVLAAEGAGGFQSNIPSIGSEELDGLPRRRLGETFPNQPVLKPDASQRLSVIQVLWKHPGRPHLIRPYQGREVQQCSAPILRGLNYYTEVAPSRFAVAGFHRRTRIVFDFPFAHIRS